MVRRRLCTRVPAGEHHFMMRRSSENNAVIRPHHHPPMTDYTLSDYHERSNITEPLRAGPGRLDWANRRIRSAT
jgi:hypothetical protein